MTTAESQISQNSRNIELKVSKSDMTGNYIIGKINLTSTTATIAAKHINLQGAVLVDGTINCNDTFTVDPQGNVTANSLTSTNANITGGTINIEASDSVTNLIHLRSDNNQHGKDLSRYTAGGLYCRSSNWYRTTKTENGV
jgi:predicted acyltransferase (DUF342 family)